MRVFLKFLFGILFVASVVIGAAVVQLHTRDLRQTWDPVRSRKADEPIPVRTVSAMLRDVDDLIGGTAVTVPSAAASLSILPKDDQVADRLVESVHAEPGSQVRKGQALVEFNREMFAAMLTERQAALRTAQHEYQALSKLYQQRGVSGLQWRESEMAVATAQLQLKLAEYELRACTVHSPLDGIVESMHVIPGMRVTGATALVEIRKLDPIHVTMDFPVERLESLQIGHQADVILDSFPGEQFSGKVVRMSTSADVRTRVLPVTIELPNPDHRIRAGITGYVRIPVGKSNATTIPRIAVIDKRDKAIVFCVRDGRAKIREIETGPVLRDGEIEVVRGLEAGEEVVVFGHDNLRDNDVVNADWKSWTNLEQEEVEEDETQEQDAEIVGHDLS